MQALDHIHLPDALRPRVLTFQAAPARLRGPLRLARTRGAPRPLSSTADLHASARVSGSNSCRNRDRLLVGCLRGGSAAGLARDARFRLFGWAAR